MSYESIQCTRIRLDDNPTCNIGIHFDLVADKIGELVTNLITCKYGTVKGGRRKPILRRHQEKLSSIRLIYFLMHVHTQDPEKSRLKS